MPVTISCAGTHEVVGGVVGGGGAGGGGAAGRALQQLQVALLLLGARADLALQPVHLTRQPPELRVVPLPHTTL